MGKSNRTKEYDQLERPFGRFLERATDREVNLGGDEEGALLGPGGGANTSGELGEGGGATQVTAKNEGSFGDVWITNWIKSKNWRPKTSGFYINGETGYAEFSNVYLSGGLTIDTQSSIKGGQIDYDTGTGFFLGYSGGAYKLSVGVGSTGPSLTWDGTQLNVQGSTITSPGAGTDLSLVDFTHDIDFSSVDSNTVQWSGGNIVTGNGQTFAVSSGNTGNMSSKTYIYFDKGSPTVLQHTTSSGGAVDANRVLIAVAENSTNNALFQVFGGKGGLKVGNTNLEDELIDNSKLVDEAVTGPKIAASAVTAVKINAGAVTAGKIAAGAITADNIAAESITAEKIASNTITANKLSTTLIYTGSLVVSSTGHIRSGQTGFNSGTGWWMGLSGGTPKFSIGDSSAGNMTWDGSTLKATDLKILYKFEAVEDISAGDPVCIVPSVGISALGNQPSIDYNNASPTGYVDIGESSGSGAVYRWAAQPFRVGSDVSSWCRFYIGAPYANWTRTNGGIIGSIYLATWDAVNKVPISTINAFGTMMDAGFNKVDSRDFYSGYSFSRVQLSPGTDYCILFQNTGADSDDHSNLIIQGSPTAPPAWDSGTYLTETAKTGTFTTGPTVYTLEEDSGLYFTWRMWELLYGSDAGGVGLSSAGIENDPRFTGHLGFANNSANRGEDVNVSIFGIAENLSGLSQGTTYYLDDTGTGALQTSAPSASYTGVRIVGRAISETEVIVSS